MFSLFLVFMVIYGVGEISYQSIGCDCFVERMEETIKSITSVEMVKQGDFWSEGFG
ncbi:hypothetical protein [Holdemanella biformis]|uniref:hypothetical protein n=1 Tax=uncultured Holdemanella sp. TaxID=1763549 RepID=UPI00258B507E|nr:hypothetical protein [uncultured Holdemanella sp.]